MKLVDFKEEHNYVDIKYSPSKKSTSRKKSKVLVLIKSGSKDDNAQDWPLVKDHQQLLAESVKIDRDENISDKGVERRAISFTRHF